MQEESSGHDFLAPALPTSGGFWSPLWCSATNNIHSFWTKGKADSVEHCLSLVLSESSDAWKFLPALWVLRKNYPPRTTLPPLLWAKTHLHPSSMTQRRFVSICPCNSQKTSADSLVYLPLSDLWPPFFSLRYSSLVTSSLLQWAQ